MAERVATCPVCRRPLDAAMRAARTAPFCSRRCADVDLGRWFRGAYQLPGEDSETVPDDKEPG